MAIVRKKRFKKKWPIYVCVGILGMLCAGLSILIYIKIAVNEPVVSVNQNENVIYPTPYSDTHITENAKTTDPQFKKLSSSGKESFLASVISSFQTPVTPITEEKQPEKGTWLWTPTLEMTPSYWNSIIAGAKENGIRNIYLSLDSYLDIFVLPDGAEKTAKQKTFDSILEKFIGAAHKNGMTVDAEAGWRNWAEQGNEYKAFAIIDYVLRFNSMHAEKFRGLQYDIEPYLLEEYAKDKADVLYNFVSLVSETTSRLKKSDLEFSVVIPDFYDKSSGETPKFFYGLRYEYTLTHLLNVLDRRPNSTLIVMAYRNFSKGTGGSIDISEEEIQTANKYNTKVLVAQETGDFPPSYITFHHTSRSYMNAQIKNIEKAFANDKSYNGVAIHYANALMELK